MSVAPKLTQEQVAIIRTQLNDHNAVEFAERFGVTKVTIQSAAQGRGSYQIYKKPPPIDWIRQKRRDSISEDEKKQIKNLVAKKDQLNLTFEQIGKMFDKSGGYIHQIASGLHD